MSTDRHQERLSLLLPWDQAGPITTQPEAESVAETDDAEGLGTGE